MSTRCAKTKKCYTRKDGKKCMYPNPWIIFLRTTKHPSVKAASASYQKGFKPTLIRLIKEASKKDRTAQQIKAIYHKQVCKYFYDAMKASGTSTPSTRKKVSSSVSKMLKKNSVPKTLAIMGAKKVADALSAKEEAEKKAAKKIADKEKAMESAKRKAAAILRQYVRAAARERVLKKEAAAAAAAASKPRVTRSKSAAAAASSKRVTRSKAKKKTDSLKDQQTRAAKRVRFAKEAVNDARKSADKINQKQQRALKRLAGDLRW
ncbi:unnamed protein product [Pylaiella littoralis]